jgi:hypothetical protein
MQPYKLVKDVRTGHETSNVDGVMDGQIDDFLKAYLMMMGQKKRNNYSFFLQLIKTRQDFHPIGFFCICYLCRFKKIAIVSIKTIQQYILLRSI